MEVSRLLAGIGACEQFCFIGAKLEPGAEKGAGAGAGSPGSKYFTLLAKSSPPVRCACSTDAPELIEAVEAAARYSFVRAVLSFSRMRG